MDDPNYPPPPPLYIETPPANSPTIPQVVATSAELIELGLRREQMREFQEPVAEHTRLLEQQGERIALLEMKNERLSEKIQYLFEIVELNGLRTQPTESWVTRFERYWTEAKAEFNERTSNVEYFGDALIWFLFLIVAAYVVSIGGLWWILVPYLYLGHFLGEF